MTFIFYIIALCICDAVSPFSASPAWGCYAVAHVIPVGIE